MQSQENFSSSTEVKIITETDENKRYRFLTGCYIVGISSVTAAVAGFITNHIAKKKGREHLKELKKEVLMESPHALAFRALAWGTFWAVGVFSVSIFGLWTYFGIKDMDDLRTRIRRYTRKRPVDPTERTEFENLSDFLTYIEERYKSEKQTKK